MVLIMPSERRGSGSGPLTNTTPYFCWMESFQSKNTMTFVEVKLVCVSTRQMGCFSNVAAADDNDCR
jgi:hypothetical protein